MAKVAMILGQDYEDSEAKVPLERLRQAGHQVEILGQKGGEEVRGKKGEVKLRTDAAVADHRPEEYDAVVIPGGFSPDHLRTDEQIVGFVRQFAGTGKPLAAVCHGPQLLIEADVVRGRTLTSWPSVRTDLKNAGARVVDQQVVVDGNLITSRHPGDLQAFSTALVEALG